MSVLQTIENRFGQNRTLNRALRSTYTIWAKSYPDWEEALFDESFVARQVKPVLHRFVTDGTSFSNADLVNAWMDHIGLSEERRPKWSQQIAPAVSDFVWIFEGEFDFERRHRERSLWFKLWHGAGTTPQSPAVQPVSVAAGN